MFGIFKRAKNSNDPVERLARRIKDTKEYTANPNELAAKKLAYVLLRECMDCKKILYADEESLGKAYEKFIENYRMEEDSISSRVIWEILVELGDEIYRKYL